MALTAIVDDESHEKHLHLAFTHPDVKILQREIAQILKRIQKSHNCMSTLFINNWGLPEDSTMKIMVATLNARVLRPFVLRCEFLIRDLDPEDKLLAVRMTTMKNEIIMVTDYDFVFVLIHKLLPEPVLYPKVPANKKKEFESLVRPII